MMVKTEAQSALAQVERRIWSAAETGNFDEARVVLIELAAYNKEAAERIGRDLAATRGIVLR